MFKNLILYKILTNDRTLNVESCLQAMAFAPCGPSQEKVSGWVPPREANGALVESIDGQQIMKLMTETKSVPADVINRKAAERCAQIEASTGRKPGKKETRDIKDDIRLELLPMAFAKQSATLVWLDVEAGFMAVGASSQAKADDVVTALLAAVPGLAFSMVNTQASPVSCMAEWLLAQEPPAGFSIDRECELKASDESNAVVRYSKHSLDIGEIPDHIMAGKMPTKLAMTWDDRVSFVLTESLQIKKLSFLDVIFENQNKGDKGGFDADVAISTGELRQLIPNLLDALGGEIDMQAEISHPVSAVKAAQNLQNMAVRDGYSVSVEDSAGEVLATFGDVDPMYQQAVDLVLSGKKPSISMVQRHLRIGYNRAACLIEDMEKAGLVSPMKSNGERDIL